VRRLWTLSEGKVRADGVASRLAMGRGVHVVATLRRQPLIVNCQQRALAGPVGTQGGRGHGGSQPGAVGRLPVHYGSHLHGAGRRCERSCKLAFLHAHVATTACLYLTGDCLAAAVQQYPTMWSFFSQVSALRNTATF